MGNIRCKKICDGKLIGKRQIEFAITIGTSPSSLATGNQHLSCRTSSKTSRKKLARSPFTILDGREDHCSLLLATAVGQISSKRAKNTDGLLFEILRLIGIMPVSFLAGKWYPSTEHIWVTIYRTVRAIAIVSTWFQSLECLQLMSVKSEC